MVQQEPLIARVREKKAVEAEGHINSKYNPLVKFTIIFKSNSPQLGLYEREMDIGYAKIFL